MEGRATAGYQVLLFKPASCNSTHTRRRYLCSCCVSTRPSMSLDQALSLLQEGLIFMRHDAGRMPIPVWLSLEDNNSVLSWRCCSTPTPPPPHASSIAAFNGARPLDSSDAQARFHTARFCALFLTPAFPLACAGARPIHRRRRCAGIFISHPCHHVVTALRRCRCWSSRVSLLC